ncbi:MAG: hypothetical protein HYR60_19105 [Acidobacteria bacterium]|nr:hypothetical protein [Acidobacteriota bacterium]
MRQVTALLYQVDYNQPRASVTPFTKDRAPFPLWNTIFSRVNGETAKYHALQAEFDRRFSGGLSLQSSYTWTRNWSDAGDSNETGSLIEDSFDRKREYSNVEFARPHKWLTVWIWELPFARGKQLAQRLAGGLELSGIVLFQSGYWFHPVFTGYDPSNTNGTSRSGSFRPDRIANGNLPSGERSLTRWFDAAAFVAPPRNAGRFGNAAPYILAGPGMFGVERRPCQAL